jgi:hypothetical protein
VKEENNDEEHDKEHRKGQEEELDGSISEEEVVDNG